MNASELFIPKPEPKPRARAEETITPGLGWFLWCDGMLCGMVHSAFVAETWCEAINLGSSPFGVNAGGRW